MKRFLISLGAAILCVSMLAGCSGAGDSSAASGSSGAEGQAAAADLKIGIIFTEAGLGGQTFNDLAFEGVKRAEAELGISYDYVEPKSVSDEEIVQDEMAASGEYGLIICIGAEQIDALGRVAPNYPDQKFALIDATLELDNVACFVSKEQEGSFLIGAMAALSKQEKISDKLTDSKTIGFIGGVNNTLINKFTAGYIAGAKYIDPSFNVLADYVGAFNDPTTAKTIATAQNEKGADIIYHAAGASGMGMIQAAQENNFLAVGVNLNQNATAPDNIMASMLKRVDSTTFYAIQSVLENTFQPGVNILGIAEGGVDYTTDESNIKLSDNVVAKLDELKDKITAGELVVPETLDQVDAFLASAK